MSDFSVEQLKKAIRDVPDFPKPGILFKDITTALLQPDCIKFIVDSLVEQYKDAGITKVVGIESRGFVMGSVLAYKLNAGFVPVRKPGKLPAETYSETYDLEYGTDTVEIHKDAISEDDVVLIHDDLLATGGTALATYRLLQNFNLKQIFMSFIIELDFLEGRKKLQDSCEVFSLINY